MIIYRLVDPRTLEPRYIGVAANYRKRLASHIAQAKNGRAKHRPGYKPTHCSRWIKCLLAIGLRPISEAVEEVNSANWADRERFWIAHYLRLGCRLTNLTQGGEGTYGHSQSPETRQKHSEAMKVACADPEVIERKRASALGHFVSEQARTKISLANAGRKQSSAEKAHRRLKSVAHLIQLRSNGEETTCALRGCSKRFRKVQESHKYCSAAHRATASTRNFRAKRYGWR